MNQHRENIQGPWLTPLSFALKKLIANDEAFAEGVVTLYGKTILFDVQGLGVQVYATFQNNEIRLQHDLPLSVDKVDVVLNGRLKDFIALAKQQRNGQSMGAGQVEIQGDLQTAQAVQDLFKRVEIDFEEILARATSDAFAYGVGSIARRAFINVRQGIGALEKDFGEYLQYEKRLTPSADELNGFTRAVDELAVDVERLELRIKKLSQALGVITD